MKHRISVLSISVLTLICACKENEDMKPKSVHRERSKNYVRTEGNTNNTYTRFRLLVDVNKGPGQVFYDRQLGGGGISDILDPNPYPGDTVAVTAVAENPISMAFDPFVYLRIVQDNPRIEVDTSFKVNSSDIYWRIKLVVHD